MPEARPEASLAYLALGSNLGDKAGHIAAAAAALDATPGLEVAARSGLWRTPPWGETDQDWFLNAALGVRTTLAPHALLDACLAVEARLGRVRTRRWGPRTIDVDVLAYADVRLRDARLTLPHPLMHARAFVLAPLSEIAPALPVAGLPAEAALARLDRTGIVRLGPMPDAATATAPRG
jgi:2-amino-4-hydroxy-6-hydroxymethyldihydropteridine diphosphokinase